MILTVLFPLYIKSYFTFPLLLLTKAIIMPSIKFKINLILIFFIKAKNIKLIQN